MALSLSQKLDKKLKAQYEKGVTLDKMSKDITMDQAKALAETHEIEVAEGDTVKDIIEAIIEDFKEEELLIRRLQRKLDRINTDIRELGNSAETTLVAAIVADRHTYVLNIGDSRAYMISGKELYEKYKDYIDKKKDFK